MEPDYTLVCDKCGVELPTTPHYAAHLRDAHGMQTSAAIKAAKVARENKGVESYAAIKAERDALRAERADMLSLLGWASDCWLEGDDLRPDFDDCIDAIRAFLGTLASAQEEGRG